MKKWCQQFQEQGHWKATMKFQESLSKSKIKKAIKSAWKGIGSTGGATECSNYRRIALEYVMHKAFAMIIMGRLKAISEDILGDYQSGFRNGRSASDQIFTIRQIMADAYEFKLPF